MPHRLLTAVTAGVCLVLSWTCHAVEGTLSQAEAETRLRQLTEQIGALKNELERARGTLSTEQRALEAADLRIQASLLALRQLASKRQEHGRELARLKAEQQDYLQSINERREILARQILTAYRLGRESRLKLVLNQDSPAELSKTLAYYDFFSRSQAKQITELRKVLLTLDEMQASISVELSALEAVEKENRQILDEVTAQREQRQVAIEALSKQIGTDEKRLTELQRNRRDLEVLLDKLSDVLADIPADLGKHLGPAELKGKLPMPVLGRVRHAYGQPRTAGLRWQGWLISTGAGSEVRAVAYGRVAFSDWLRGYGLLMIIDHGDGFMTLYDNNESLLFEVGDWVEPNSIISTVGDSQLNGTGLYFEIRRHGKAMDPAVWLKR